MGQPKISRFPYPDHSVVVLRRMWLWLHRHTHPQSTRSNRDPVHDTGATKSTVELSVVDLYVMRFPPFWGGLLRRDWRSGVAGGAAAGTTQSDQWGSDQWGSGQWGSDQWVSDQ